MSVQSAFSHTYVSAALASAQLNTTQGEADAENELRLAALARARAFCVGGGLLAAINGTTLTFAAGDGYTGTGQRVADVAPFDFVGQGANTYHVRWDQSSEVIALDTVAPSDLDIYLAEVTWNGTTTLSGLVDQRRLLTTGTLFLPAAEGWPSTTAGAGEHPPREFGTNDVDLVVMSFDPVIQEHAQWSVLMPDDWDGGTIAAQFVWSAASGSGGVTWGLQGRTYGDGDAIDQSWGTAQEVADTLLLADDLHVSAATAAITLAGTGSGACLAQFRAYRDPSDASDTIAVDALMIGVTISYTHG